ncbi:MAG TPA: alpha-amylase family protein [Gemmataceae bacterium]|nr:alpha-amylase family protein [Gemmataceae bacterium]
MDPGSSAHAPSRREVLKAAACGLPLALASSTWPGTSLALDAAAENAFKPIRIPEWVHGVSRMAFVAPGEVDKAAKAGVQVVHGNAVWPYFPLRRDGGKLKPEEDRILHKFADDSHRLGMKLVLGLPPFPSVDLVKRHPDWRIHPDNAGSILKVEPREDNLGTRVGCNLGPWGNYLIEICVELLHDYHLDGYSFDGNYHPSICYCPACKNAYRQDRQRDLPAAVNLDELGYRQYLVWRGERLEDHYRRLQERLKKENPEAVLMSWTVNAGRYGHFLSSPRSMSARMNLLFDLPMQEWWLDETNFGGSVAPACGAAYLRGLTGSRPCASEAYLMSRGNPYGTDSFPVHERLTRNLLAIANGSITAEALGWPGHEQSTYEVFRQVGERERWLTRTTPLPWAGLLVSEQTRQFYAYKDIADRFLPHVYGAFRCGLETHLPLAPINDWDLTPEALSRYAVLVLPNAAALSDAQTAAVRSYVQAGGGLVATGETSLCDELGRRRRNFALADVLGVDYQGTPKAPKARPELDANFAVVVDENYWRQRVGVATLTWTDHPIVRDTRLRQLVPNNSVTFRGPLVQVSKPKEADAVAVSMTPEGMNTQLPAAIARTFGKGRVVYFAAAVDGALWSYAYPYQRCLFARALEWAARDPAPISVRAPMCVQASYFTQSTKEGKRVIVHLFNGVNTAANHGLPAMDVPLREEVVPIHDIEVRFSKDAPKSFHLEPGSQPVKARREGEVAVVLVPRLEIHTILVGEF